jgi:hypothetical protein
MHNKGLSRNYFTIQPDLLLTRAVLQSHDGNGVVARLEMLFRDDSYALIT